MDKFQTPVLNAQNALKLGIFGINLRGGVTLADVEGNVRGTWEENLRLARWADRLGVDAIVPIARWRGYGGAANLGDRSFETFTWATGLMAATERIQAFATMHVPLAHPVMVAKMAATADHVSGGRFGLNIVAGWHTEQLAMFGVGQREHDERYEVADEWARVLKQLWTTRGEADFHGRFFDGGGRGRRRGGRARRRARALERPGVGALQAAAGSARPGFIAPQNAGARGAGFHRLEDRVLARGLAGELRADPAAVEDEHAIADGGELVEIGRGEQH